MTNKDSRLCFICLVACLTVVAPNTLLPCSYLQRIISMCSLNKQNCPKKFYIMLSNGVSHLLHGCRIVENVIYKKIQLIWTMAGCVFATSQLEYSLSLLCGILIGIAWGTSVVDKPITIFYLNRLLRLVEVLREIGWKFLTTVTRSVTKTCSTNCYALIGTNVEASMGLQSGKIKRATFVS